MTFSRRLNRPMVLLVLGTLTLLAVSGFFLLLSPSLDSIAFARIGQLAAIVESRLQRLAWSTERQLQIAGRWLSDGGLSLEHRALNRRFMPVLDQCPEYSAMSIADAAGNEWMLYKKPDGGWMNRLTKAGDADGGHRFLHWQDSRTLEQDERQPSDYTPSQRPWFRESMNTPRGQTAWTGIYRFFTAGKPGISASMRIAAADGKGELIIALDLLLDDVADHLGKVRIGRNGLAVLLSDEGRLLGITGRSGEEAFASLEGHIFQLVTGVELEPLQKGLGLWRERAGRFARDRLVWHDGELWHVGYRRLALGEERVWLGVHLPVSELLPGLYPQLLVLAAIAVIAVGGILSLVTAMARSVSRPLEQMADNSRQIGILDFSAPEPIESDIREITQLAEAQDEMRRLLASAHDELAAGHRKPRTARAQKVTADRVAEE